MSGRDYRFTDIPTIDNERSGVTRFYSCYKSASSFFVDRNGVKNYAEIVGSTGRKAWYDVRISTNEVVVGRKTVGDGDAGSMLGYTYVFFVRYRRRVLPCRSVYGRHLPRHRIQVPRTQRQH